MRAAVLTDDPPRLEVVELPDPTPGPGDVVVRVTACGVCGSDLNVATTSGAPGTVLGHEIAGTLEDGSVVAVRPFVGCEACAFCADGRQDHCPSFEFVGAQRPGGFAEYVVARQSELFRLPAVIRPQDHALIEPFAVARRALRRSALERGESVIVLGAGPLGLAVVHWARVLGAGRIVVSDPIASRRDLACVLGADDAVAPEDIHDSAPLVIECTGKPRSIDRAMQLAAIDGRVAVVGICLDRETFRPWWGLSKELDVRFSLYYGREDFTDTIDGFARGLLSPDGLVTETVSLDALPARFAQLAVQPDGGKLVVTP